MEKMPSTVRQKWECGWVVDLRRPARHGKPNSGGRCPRGTLRWVHEDKGNELGAFCLFNSFFLKNLPVQFNLQLHPPPSILLLQMENLLRRDVRP
jgi:hypothetical protein